MVKWYKGRKYVLMTRKYPNSNVVICDCTKCAAVGNAKMCLDFGNDCMGRGIYEEDTQIEMDLNAKKEGAK